MKSAISIIPTLLLISLCMSHPAYSWDCSVDLDGPSWVKIGRTIDLTASGLPDGGYYSWSAASNLIPNGSTATLTGFMPDYSDYIRVSVRYTTPKGHSCSETKWVYAHPCEVWVSGPAEAQIGEQITLQASTDCDSGGDFSWPSLPGLMAEGATAIYTPQSPEDQEITATYTFPDGPSASGTHALAVKGCIVSIAGPSEIEMGEKTTLTAAGIPTGGTYGWNTPLDFIGQSATAEVFGSSAGEQPVSVTYTLDDTDSISCNATHLIKVRDCQVSLAGLSIAAIGEPTLITADGLPSGGSCTWLSPTDLLEQELTAQFTAQTPGLQTFEAEYTTPSGDTCPDTHDTTFIKVGSIASPYSCVNSGTTLEKGSFFVTSEPPGYLDGTSLDLSISPLILNTLSQSSTETIIASITPKSILDDATTTLTVVNPDVKTSLGSDIKIEIPDYFSDALSKIGLADKAMLKFGNSMSKRLNCCEYSSINEGRELQFSMGIAAEVGPFTIIGVPMPKGLKKYVTLDALAVTFAGTGEGSIKGDYEGCRDATQWSGAGDFSATVDVGGEVKAKSPGEVIVLEGTLKGSTGVSESVSVTSPNMVLSGNWDGLTVKGEVKLTYRTLSLVKKPASWPLLSPKPIPQATISLPSLN